MSVSVENKDKIKATASMLVIYRGDYGMLLHDVFDELYEMRGRDVWRTLNWSLITAGASGLFHWFVEDVTTADSLQNFKWITFETLCFSGILLIGLILYAVYSGTAGRSRIKSKKEFINKYSEHQSFNILGRDFEVSARAIRTTSGKGAQFVTEPSSEKEST